MNTRVQQVCTAQLGKRLMELGVKSPSDFYWITHRNGDVEYYELKHGEPHPVQVWVPAYTVAELGLMLPRGFGSGRPFGKDLFECWPMFYAKVPEDHEVNEADARAKMLIYLIETGAIEVPS